jgi:hypothetical protein
MQKRQRTEVTQALARVGALAQVRELLTLFPDLIDEINKLAPKRRLSSAMRAELAAHVDASTNGSTPKLKQKRKKWSAAQHKKFMATVARKKRESAAASK